jgi:hypothetical protein
MTLPRFVLRQALPESVRKSAHLGSPRGEAAVGFAFSAVMAPANALTSGGCHAMMP